MWIICTINYYSLFYQIRQFSKLQARRNYLHQILSLHINCTKKQRSKTIKTLSIQTIYVPLVNKKRVDWKPFFKKHLTPEPLIEKVYHWHSCQFLTCPLYYQICHYWCTWWIVWSWCPRSCNTWRPFCNIMMPGGWFLWSIFFFHYWFSKRKGKYFYTFNHSYSEKSSNKAT